MKLSKNKKELYLKKLIDFLKIRSISAQSEYKHEILNSVNFIVDFLRSSGFHNENISLMYPKDYDSKKDNSLNPVVFAERISDEKYPTILIYGHYDVQPPEPLDEWETPPFEPTVRDGKIFARGSTDDKGQVFTHLAAINELFLEYGEGKWPINLKLIIEGEEETSGECLKRLIDENHKKFKADVCLVSDSSFIEENKPTIEYGLKGIAYLEIKVRQSDKDLHSGVYGGAVMNPANALVYILSKLYDQKTGKVLIPDFYKDVIEISTEEKEKLSKIPFNEKEFLKDAGNSKATFSEEGYTPIEHSSARPTLDINGMYGGFIGEGAKTIIPAYAQAKVSMRLVPNQNPEKIVEIFKKYVNEISPSEVDVEIIVHSTGKGVLMDLDSKYIKVVEEALKESFSCDEIIYARSGGSIPIVADIKTKLKMDVILVGYGLPDDGLHSPNEKFDLDQFYKGIETNLLIYKNVGSDSTNVV